MYMPKSAVPINTTQTSGYMPKSAVPIQQPQKTLGGFASNVLKSGGRLIGDTVSALANAFNPNMEKNTLANIAKLTTGAAQKLDPTQGNQIVSKIPGLNVVQGLTGNQEQTAQNVADFYKQRYGGLENIGNTFYNDPVGMAADVATVASGVGGLLKGAGAVTGAGNVTRAGEALTKAGVAYDPILASTKGVGKITRPISKVFNRVAPNSEIILTRGIGTPPQQSKMLVPMEELIPKYNLFERTPESAQQALKTLNKQRTAAVESSGVYGNLQDLLAPLDKEIAKIKNNPNLFRGDMPLSPEASKRLSQLVENRNNIVKRFAQTQNNVTNLNPSVKVSDIDFYRRENIDPNIPKKAYEAFSQTPAKDKAFKQTRDVLSDVVNEAAGTQQMGRDMQSLIKAEEIFKSYQNRIKNRQILNLYKLGGASVGGFLAGFPGAVGGFLAEQVVNSPMGLKAIYNVLKTTENIGSKANFVEKLTAEFRKIGVRNPSAIASDIYNFARAGRMLEEK